MIILGTHQFPNIRDSIFQLLNWSSLSSLAQVDPSIKQRIIDYMMRPRFDITPASEEYLLDQITQMRPAKHKVPIPLQKHREWFRLQADEWGIVKLTSKGITTYDVDMRIKGAWQAPKEFQRELGSKAPGLKVGKDWVVVNYNPSLRFLIRRDTLQDIRYEAAYGFGPKDYFYEKSSHMYVVKLSWQPGLVMKIDKQFNRDIPYKDLSHCSQNSTRVIMMNELMGCFQCRVCHSFICYDKRETAGVQTIENHQKKTQVTGQNEMLIFTGLGIAKVWDMERQMMKLLEVPSTEKCNVVKSEKHIALLCMDKKRKDVVKDCQIKVRAKSEQCQSNSPVLIYKPRGDNAKFVLLHEEFLIFKISSAKYEVLRISENLALTVTVVTGPKIEFGKISQLSEGFGFVNTEEHKDLNTQSCTKYIFVKLRKDRKIISDALDFYKMPRTRRSKCNKILKKII